MLFAVAFGACPPQSSLRLRGARLHPALPQGRPTRKRAWSPHPRPLRRTVPPFPACAVQAGTFRLRVPPTPSHPRSRGLLPRLAAVLPTDRVCLSRLVTRRGPADRVSDRFVHGHPPFRGFSPSVTTRSSRFELSSMPFPTLRCRGSEDVSSRWMRSPESALFTPSMGRSSLGRFPPSRMTSRPRPTLLRGSSHGLLSCSRARPAPRGCPPGSCRAPVHVRSSEFQRTGSLPGVTGLPPWGSCRRFHPSSVRSRGCRRLPVDATDVATRVTFCLR